MADACVEVDSQKSKVAFHLPESGLAGSWWLTNPDGPPDEAPRFLWQSLSVLVADLHQSRVATVAKLNDELHQRFQRNRELMAQLSNTRVWRRLGPQRWVSGFLALAAGRAGPGVPEPSAAELEDLERHWAANPPEAAGPDDPNSASQVVRRHLSATSPSPLYQ